MKTRSHNAVLISSVLLTMISGNAFGHGLMVDPPSRNATCGLAEDQKPHNATIPACIEAFQNDQNGGYQFMSVLTHDVGRQGVSPLPGNVCGFDSETWDSYNNGNTTPWDLPVDWPTSGVQAGPLDITWNISWGPHFDDTEEFVYYITKADFQYQVGTPLAWSDFEATPFCKQTYDDSNPTANPGVIADKGATTFKTSCTLPQRNGRHVIYGEWGRNFFTFERFHGCIDVTFGDNGPINQRPVADAQSVSVQQDSSVSVTLTGSDPDGSVTAFNISQAPANGSLSGTGSSVVYTPNAGFAGSDSFYFTVTDNQSATSLPAQVSITVTGDGTSNVVPTADFSYVANNLSVNFDASASSDGDNGPQPLSYSWTFGDGQTGTGVTPSHTYSTAGSYQAELTVSDGADSASTTKTVSVSGPGGGGSATCEYIISNSWNSGFVAEIRIMNTGTSVIDGWEVNWSYTDGSAITNGWNSVLTGSGSGPYSATNLEWNRVIQPGETAVFGFQGSHGGNTAVVNVTGAVCN